MSPFPPSCPSIHFLLNLAICQQVCRFSAPYIINLIPTPRLLIRSACSCRSLFSVVFLLGSRDWDDYLRIVEKGEDEHWRVLWVLN